MRTLVGTWALDGRLVVYASRLSLAHIFGLSENIRAIKLDLWSSGKIEAWQIRRNNLLQPLDASFRLSDGAF